MPLTEDIMYNMMSNSDYVHIDSMMLLEAIGQLKEGYQTAIILFYYYDYSIKTISEMMEIPEGTVKTYLSRGKEALKKVFKGEMNYG